MTRKAIKKDDVYNREIAFLSNPNETDKYSLEDIAKRVQPLVIDNYKSYITSNIADSLISDFIKRNFDEFLDLVEANVSDDDLKAYGEEINRDINKNNFIIEGDITNTKYDNASRDAINTLKELKMVGRRPLKDEDIKEYEDSLKYTNQLLSALLF